MRNVNKVLQENNSDNVGTVLQDITVGSNVSILRNKDNQIIKSLKCIQRGHKIALSDIMMGDFVIKYGEVIGVAKEAIRKGDWVHVHNMRSRKSLPVRQR